MPPPYVCTFGRIRAMKPEYGRLVYGVHSPQFPTDLPNACGYLSSPLVLPGNTQGRVRDVPVTISAYSALNIHTRDCPHPRHQAKVAVWAPVLVSDTQAVFYWLLRRNIALGHPRKLLRCRSVAGRRDQSFRQQDLQVRDNHDTQTF